MEVIACRSCKTRLQGACRVQRAPYKQRWMWCQLIGWNEPAVNLLVGRNRLHAVHLNLVHSGAAPSRHTACSLGVLDDWRCADRQQGRQQKGRGKHGGPSKSLFRTRPAQYSATTSCTCEWWFTPRTLYRTVRVLYPSGSPLGEGLW